MATVMTKVTPEKGLRKVVPGPFSIFEEMDRLSKAIEERAFRFFEERGRTDGSDLNDWFRAQSELVRTVPIEVEEREKDVIVRAEVPGFEASELSVTAEPLRVSVCGKTEKKQEEKKEEKNGNLKHYSEFSSSEVLRQISLPAAIDPEKATAHLEKGVLEVKLPKAAPAKQVEVKATA